MPPLRNRAWDEQIKKNERPGHTHGQGAHLYAHKKQQNTTQDHHSRTIEATAPTPDALYGP